MRSEHIGKLRRAAADVVQAWDLDTFDAKNLGGSIDRLRDVLILTNSVPSGPVPRIELYAQTASTNNGSFGNEEEVGTNLEGGISAEQKLFDHYLVVLSQYAGGIHPNPARVKNPPGPRTLRILKKALQDATLEQCMAAVDGAYADWTERHVAGKSITDIFTTFRGTGSLPDRIQHFASKAPREEPARTGLDAPGVRDRLHDVRREVRAALDHPSPQNRRRAGRQERWLAGIGFHLAIGDAPPPFEHRGQVGFTIGPGAPAVFYFSAD